MKFSEMSSAAYFSGIPEVLSEMVYLTGPQQPIDLVEDEFIIIEENQASETPMRQSLRKLLQLAETNNKILETALAAKDEYANLVEAKYARELQDKEIETKKVLENLQEQLDEARGQLYEGQPPSFFNIPEPPNSDESEHSQSENYSEEGDPSGEIDSDILCEAVAMASNKSYQEALIHIDTKISATDPTKLYANATLIKSAILRLCDDPERGLELAEHVVYIANLNNLPTILAKAQLYRGLCLNDFGLYADALRCYVRAASIRWFARDVPRLSAMAGKKMDALPNGSKGKHLSSDFQEIPLSTSAKGFGSS